MEDCEELIAEWEAANRQKSRLVQIQPALTPKLLAANPSVPDVDTTNLAALAQADGIKHAADTESQPVATTTGATNEYEVKCVLDRCLTEEGVEKFLVWWEGYPIEESTWEREVNLQAAKEALEEYRSLQRIPPVLDKFMGIDRKKNSERVKIPLHRSPFVVW